MTRSTFARLAALIPLLLALLMGCSPDRTAVVMDDEPSTTDDQTDTFTDVSLDDDVPAVIAKTDACHDGLTPSDGQIYDNGGGKCVTTSITNFTVVGNPPSGTQFFLVAINHDGNTSMDHGPDEERYYVNVNGGATINGTTDNSTLHVRYTVGDVEDDHCGENFKMPQVTMGQPVREDKSLTFAIHDPEEFGTVEEVTVSFQLERRVTGDDTPNS